MPEQIAAERWRKVKEIVAEALDVKSAAARTAFIEQRCGGDAELVREVQSLLDQTTSQMENYAANASRAAKRGAIPLEAGRRIGAYAIIRELGIGGMGVVFLARRADKEFEKEVAIKLLKRGTDTDEVLRRFRAEREILARLEHPNIARLIDAGTSEDGLPYFVMEYVAGVPVTTFCSANNLSIEKRLRLFLKVCSAVQFAHQNLVVHRDLKPANILVTPEGEPKLLDFGIAKLLEPEDSAYRLTLAHQQRLTAGYASPEQVRGEPVTTVSDVYALGALLYQMLSGSPAHRFTHASPSPSELLQVVGEQTPLRPSVAAADRQTARSLHGDLDNIVLQALRKEPTRRYAGVGAFVDDVRRHLDNFPVRARKDTLVYRTSKFVRRNRLGVAAAVLIVLAVATGLVVAAREAHVARVERRKAEERFNQVRELAHSVLFDYHDAIATLPGSTSIRQRLVQDALRYLDNLSKEAGNDRRLLRELGDAYVKVSAVQGGVATLSNGTLLSASNLGDTSGAVTSCGKAIAVLEQLAELRPRRPDDLRSLAEAYDAMGALYIRSGPPEKAVEYIRKAILILEPLLSANPSSEDLLYGVASAYSGLGQALGNPAVSNLGDTKGALDYIRKSIEIDERLAAQHPDNRGYKEAIASSHNVMGLMYSLTDNRQAQLEENEKAAAMDRELVAVDPGNTFYRRELAVQLGNIGTVLVQLKKKPEALANFREALAIYEALAAADPSDVSIYRNLAVGYRNVAVGVGATDQTEALRNFDKATKIFADIVAKDLKNDDFRRQWAYTYLAKSSLQNTIDDCENAVLTAEQGITIEKALVVDSPANATAQTTLALLYRQLGNYDVKWASRSNADGPTKVARWRLAKEAYTQGLNVYQAMKDKGILSEGDTNKPEELGAEITKCESALNSLAQGKTP